MISRRNVLGILATPAIVKFANIMPVRAIPLITAYGTTDFRSIHFIKEAGKRTYIVTGYDHRGLLVQETIRF